MLNIIFSKMVSYVFFILGATCLFVVNVMGEQVDGIPLIPLSSLFIILGSTCYLVCLLRKLKKNLDDERETKI